MSQISSWQMSFMNISLPRNPVKILVISPNLFNIMEMSNEIWKDIIFQEEQKQWKHMKRMSWVFSSSITHRCALIDCCPCKYFSINPETLTPVDVGELNVCKKYISLCFSKQDCKLIMYFYQVAGTVSSQHVSQLSYTIHTTCTGSTIIPLPHSHNATALDVSNVWPSRLYFSSITNLNCSDIIMVGDTKR